MTFVITAQSRGGAPLEIRCEEGGIETVPSYLAEMIMERAERGDAVAATPAGPAFPPIYEGADAAVLHLVLEVLAKEADPDTIETWGEVPDWSGMDLDEIDDEVGEDRPAGRPGGLRLVSRNDD